MEWLLQNWLWIALGVGALFFMMRMGGCGMGHSAGHHSHEESSDTAPPPANRPGNLYDPVSGHAFAAGNAPISTVCRGRAYYFESRENRDAFEANPDKYLAGAPAVGELVGSERDYDQQPRHRHHGC